MPAAKHCCALRRMKAAKSMDAGQAGRAVERPAAPEGARQGRIRRSRGPRRDRARPPAALRIRGVAGCPRLKGSAETWPRPQGVAFPNALRLQDQKPQAYQHNTSQNYHAGDPRRPRAPKAPSPAKTSCRLDHAVIKRQGAGGAKRAPRVGPPKRPVCMDS